MIHLLYIRKAIYLKPCFFTPGTADLWGEITDLESQWDALNSPEMPHISSERKWTLTLGRLSSHCDYCGVVPLRDIKLKYIQNGFWQGQSTACIKMSLKSAVIVMAHKYKNRSLSFKWASKCLCVCTESLTDTNVRTDLSLSSSGFHFTYRHIITTYNVTWIILWAEGI